MSDFYKQQLQKMLTGTGIAVNGEQPWDVQVHDERFYRRVFAQGSLGLGEAYMAGWWDALRLDELFYRVLRGRLETKVKLNWPMLVRALSGRMLNPQSKKHAFEIGERHYDMGNDLYRAMLGARMVYTCGYWDSPVGRVNTLDEAQDQKLDLVCRKIGLRAGQKVLDIGCGWGSFAKFAAEKYGAQVVGITVSQAQLELGRRMCAGLPVELRLQDYREVDEQFDHIISLGMFEHVGYKNYRAYMEVANHCLKDDGLLLLHTIGSTVSVKSTDPWIQKYIFLNSMLPSIQQISRAAEGLFVVEDWHNFGADYDHTLMAWYSNFTKAWPALSTQYNERFYRMWNYYLLSCAGSFRARSNQLWQIVLSKNGVLGGYQSIR